MHAPVLTAKATPSALDAGATAAGAVMVIDAGKPGDPGQVDAFTQALTALLGLPSGPLPQPVGPNAAAPANAAQELGLLTGAPRGLALGAVRADVAIGAAAAGDPVPRAALALSGASAADQQPPGHGALEALLALARQTPAAAPISGVTPPVVATPTAANPQTDLGIVQPARTQTVAPAASHANPPPSPASTAATPAGGLAALALADRIQSTVVAPAATPTAAEAAAAPSVALAPLIAGAGRVALTLQPASVENPKAPTTTSGKNAAKAEGAPGLGQPTADQSAEAEPVESLRALPAAQGEGQGNSSGGAGRGQAAQSESALSTQAAPASGAPSAALAAQAAAPQPPLAIPPADASPIAAQLATQVIKAVEGKAARFDIALEPAGLGRVDVKLQIDVQGQVSAQFSFASPHAAAAAKAESAQLQQALEQAGFSVGQGGLSFDVGGQGASLARQQSASQPPQAPLASQSMAADDPVAAASQALTRRQASGLDIII